jgi:hypothetical protein
MTNEPTWTCQICGRAIKAKNGLIAHHGYKRPGMGWQTASCFGAKFRPYEVASDALPLAITQITGYINAVTKAFAETQANPPAHLETTVNIGNAWTRRAVAFFTPRPADFNPGSPRDGERFNLHMQNAPTYGLVFEGLQRNRKNDILASHQTLNYMRDRLAAWKDPQA